MLHEYLWWFERIICRKVNGEEEDTALVWTVWLQTNKKQHAVFISYEI